MHAHVYLYAYGNEYCRVCRLNTRDSTHYHKVHKPVYSVFILCSLQRRQEKNFPQFSSHSKWIPSLRNSRPSSDCRVPPHTKSNAGHIRMQTRAARYVGVLAERTSYGPKSCDWYDWRRPESSRYETRGKYFPISLNGIMGGSPATTLAIPSTWERPNAMPGMAFSGKCGIITLGSFVDNRALTHNTLYMFQDLPSYDKNF